MVIMSSHQIFSVSCSSYLHAPLLFPGLSSYTTKDKRVCYFDSTRLICRAISKPARTTPEYSGVLQNGLPLIKWREIVEDDIQEQEEPLKVSLENQIRQGVDIVKSMLGSMEDGEISISAYDTAWVALVENIHHPASSPQFPSALQWIANNQLPDGSWGDPYVFLAHDRLINTLACVIALKKWNIHPNKYKKGLSFVKENISKLEKENEEHMPIGFEIAFPSLLEMAKKLGIEIPDDCPALQDIYAKRDLKLTRIPKDIMHNVPTTLLHSLEGLPGLDWEKLVRLQCKDGSFLFSPSSTACALMHTKDGNCFSYLNNMVQKFNGGVPNVYPVDLFEHIWSVDRLLRLGISRFFQPEIKQCLDHVHRYWTKDGICWARNSSVQDIDDTSMGFRLLRLHGYEVSPDVFKQFRKGDEFVCFVGQSNQAITGIYNLYRASQLMFPEEPILVEAKKFARNFLREKRAVNELLDKWIITKDLPGEVGFALDVPWYACLPRVETRLYIEQYGGQDDVWIGKSLYRMPYVNNNIYLELAKLDYNNCQSLHRTEWDNIQEWYEEYNVRGFGVSKRSLLKTYFVATASIFEPERSVERLAWTKTAILLEVIGSYFKNSREERVEFANEFQKFPKTRGYINARRLDGKMATKEVIEMVFAALNHFSLDALVVHGQDITHHLYQSWEKWVLTWQEEGDRREGEAELLVQTINLMAGHTPSQELLYERLFKLTNKVCHQLGRHHHLNKDKQLQQVQDNGGYNNSNPESISKLQIDSDMRELVQLVLNSSDDMDSNIKQTFLTITKSFYYTAFTHPGTVNYHIAKVLFETV
uniref:(-)-kolavenyl diphosphate synthase n=1 Tax=Tripterygium wilfordii TaxID=458696 RepID=A0A1B0YKB9_TRIWF|nr:terpene synthase 3 [Tripterygium wilfordii]